jgi:protein O-GlcNAc transferase
MQLAIQHHQAGRIPQAQEVYRSVLRDFPDQADAMQLLGVIELQAGRFESAIELIGRAVEVRPDFAEGHNNLGVALSRGRSLDAGIAAFRRAIQINPAYIEACDNLGNALRQKRAFGEALAVLRRALEIKPDSAKTHYHLGNVFYDMGDFEQAAGAFERAVGIDPNYAEAHNNLAIALCRRSMFDAALVACGRALRLRPNSAEIYNTLAFIQRKKGLTDEAISSCRKALAINPVYAEAHYTLGCVLRDIGKLDESVGALREAIRLRPAFASAHDNLGAALAELGLLDEAIASYDRALAAAPHDAIAQSNRLYTLSFHPGYGPAALWDEAKKWNMAHGAQMRPLIKGHGNDRNPNRRIRIGYVSPDFRFHCQACFMIPLLRAHDRERFEIYCYSSVVRPDEITARFPPLVDMWRDVLTRSDAELAEMIHGDGIDILVDLTMHMGGGRPLLFARKPAPVQVAWLAYPGTTGLSAMDYRLTDPYLDPPGLNDANYSEVSIRLPETFWSYDPLMREPDVNELPASGNGYVTFGCLNAFRKINDEVLALWSRVMEATGNSRLIMLVPPGTSRTRILAAFSSGKIEEDRIQFVGYQPRPDYFRTYHKVDIGLDTFPYNGHTTTLDSLWMGVPVVTLVGSTVVGRAGLSLMSNIGLTELVASTREDFVNIASTLASDERRLSHLRSILRQRMMGSPLVNANRFARAIESAYLGMWGKWCEG